MANLTLLDIAKLNGSDQVVGLIEEVITSAPEMQVIPARTIRGTSFRTVKRTGLPTTGFTSANEGIAASKSAFDTDLVQCYIFRGRVEVDKAVADAHEDGAANVQAIEASGTMMSALIEIGSQIYYGTSNEAKGFPGLQALVNSSIVVDAGGTTESTASSVYGVKFGDQFCQLVMGNGVGFEMSDWRVESVTDSGGTNKFPGYVSDLSAWIGLQVANPYSIGRLKDATADSDKGVTDAKLGELLSKFPVGIKPDVWFMNRRSAYQLQASRSATTYRKGAAGAIWAPQPTESNGIPIVVTDSITNTETLS